MRLLLLSAILFIGITARTQNTFSFPVWPPNDTTYCLLHVVDTTSTMFYFSTRLPECRSFFILGYRVEITTGRGEYVFLAENGFLKTSRQADTKTHYLNKDKKTLPPSLIVWEAKPVSQ